MLPLCMNDIKIGSSFSDNTFLKFIDNRVLVVLLTKSILRFSSLLKSFYQTKVHVGDFRGAVFRDLSL